MILRSADVLHSLEYLEYIAFFFFFLSCEYSQT